MTDDALASVRRLNTKTSCSGVILITGASGRVARRTAELLARDGHGLRLMTRSPERAPLHRNAFQAAAQAGVRHIVYLSLQGAAADSKYPFSRDHYLSEEYLLATGVPCTVLRNAFYLDMFLERFDAAGVIRGPAGQGRGAFVSRGDVARTAAARLLQRPRGIHELN